MHEPDRQVVGPDAYLTLHYRLAIAGGVDIVNTFDSNPATFLLGSGQLGAPLEQQLIGMAEGERRIFEMDAEQAYGTRQAELVQRISRSLLDSSGAQDMVYAVGDVVELAAPDGGRFAAQIRELDANSAVLDFNHPLAGQRLVFEAQIIGIL